MKLLQVLLAVTILATLGLADTTVELAPHTKIILKADSTWQLADPATTLNQKPHKIVINSNGSWQELLPPPPPPKPIPPKPKQPVIVFKDMLFGDEPQKLYKIFASKKDTIKEIPADDAWFLEDTFAGENALLVFYFKNKHFALGNAIIRINSNKKLSAEEYKNIYLRIKKTLISIYGQPQTSSDLIAEWDFDSATIKLVLAKQDNNFYLSTFFKQKDQVVSPEAEATSSESEKVAEQTPSVVARAAKSAIQAKPIPKKTTVVAQPAPTPPSSTDNQPAAPSDPLNTADSSKKDKIGQLQDLLDKL